ncbi:hypothetical protein N8654_03855 [Synechococcus sp. AH-601-B19]|nr:hypothetical protein [Synechococcus sp. AH-601-B19]
MNDIYHPPGVIPKRLLLRTFISKETRQIWSWHATSKNQFNPIEMPVALGKCWRIKPEDLSAKLIEENYKGKTKG